jgi:hypothetical protein
VLHPIDSKIFVATCFSFETAGRAVGAANLVIDPDLTSPILEIFKTILRLKNQGISALLDCFCHYLVQEPVGPSLSPQIRPTPLSGPIGKHNPLFLKSVPRSHRWRDTSNKRQE